MKTGIHFKKVKENKLLNIHPETLINYLALLPKNDAGWVTFRLKELEQINERGTFCEAVPMPAKNRT